MISNKSRFALVFGSRAFFPSSLIHSAVSEMVNALGASGNEAIMHEGSELPHCAIENAAQGRLVSRFLAENRDRYDGVILCLPNFGDESAALEALKGVRKPVLVQAYPDELGKLDPANRRDSFCGKFSIMNVLRQQGVPFTALKPHVVHPGQPAFLGNVDLFDRVCRVVAGMSDVTVGAIGARTTPFKTVRFDEIALQRRGITVETIDLSEVSRRMDSLDVSRELFKDKAAHLRSTADWSKAPEQSLVNLAKLAVVLDELIAEYGMDALAVRCWTDLQIRYGISPCVVNGDLTERGIPAACEVDVANALAMYALQLASGEPSGVFDWNNNYGKEENKCILFHCGNTPRSLMRERGIISDHLIIGNSVGEGRGFGCNQGRLRTMEFTYGSMITRKERLQFYLGTGRITADPIDKGFFGCAGVAEIDDLPSVLHWIGQNGHLHHVSIAPGTVTASLEEAFGKYLDYDLTILDNLWKGEKAHA